MLLIELQDQYYDSLKRFVQFHVKKQWIAEDIVQESFMKAHKNIDSLNDKAKAKPWLYKIAWNLCLNFFKKNKKEPEFLLDQNKVASYLTDIQSKMEQDEMGDCVQNKIQKLPIKLKQVLSLYDIEEFSHKDISLILDISVETTKTRLHRARKALKEILQRECSFQRDNRDIFVCLPKEKNNDH
ncbi:MAG: RNA polymerase sigma factor [Desulfobacterales bacterium]|nr:RNA polymerase sigma factor [Desulfobacterales bacterium]MCP4159825.1 RNA polymerase sigma factor [Deltaproteobacteria bacterium]